MSEEKLKQRKREGCLEKTWCGSISGRRSSFTIAKELNKK